MLKPEYCLLQKRDISDADCSKLVLDLPADKLAQCRKDCPRGRALAKSANVVSSAPAPREDLSLSARPAPSAKHKPLWDHISAITGCKSPAALGAKIGVTGNAVRLQLRALEAGRAPRSDNHVLPKLLKLTGLTLDQLQRRNFPAPAAGQVFRTWGLKTRRGARKLTSRRTGGLQRCISAGQILRTWGLKTRRGAHYPLTIGPGGLLVATIAAPARQEA